MGSRTLLSIAGGLLLLLLMPSNLSALFNAQSSPIKCSASYGNIVHEGNLTVSDGEVFLIEDCVFHQNGSVRVKDNATLIVRNSEFHQTCDVSEYVLLTDSANLLIENSSFHFSQPFDVKISVFNESQLNITDSTLSNSLSGLWIWMERNALLCMSNSNLATSGDGGRVITDQECLARIHSSTIDYVVSWGNSVANVSQSEVRRGVKTWSASRAYVSDSLVDFVWATQDSRLELRNTTIPSSAQFEVALRAVENANAYFFSCMLDDNVNVANDAKVRLRDSSVRNVSAYHNASVWLINSTADSVHTEDLAKVYNFSSLQEAVDNAGEGDLIPIPIGVYREQIVVNKTVSLVGEDPRSTCIEGFGAESIVSIIANHVFFSGFTVQNGEYGLCLNSVTNATIADCIVEYNTDGILLNGSSNCTLVSNELVSNGCALSLYLSDGSAVVANDFGENGFAVVLNASRQNNLHHNNFLNNTHPAIMANSTGNVFDGYGEGNYWSNHGQVDLDHNGIGDSPYAIDGNTQDDFPLMGLFRSYRSLSHVINVISNSTIEAFDYFFSSRTIRMLVLNSTSDQSHGFCRVSIPLSLIDASSLTVVIDNGSTPVLFQNYSLLRNDTHVWIYFAYEHSKRDVTIVSESSIVLILLSAAATVTLVAAKRKKRHTSQIAVRNCL